MKCIETLARVNVLCVDKTGTITEPGMCVYKFEPVDESKKTEVFGLISDMAAASSKDNATMEALQEYFNAGSGRIADKVYPFSSQTKYSGVTFENETYVIGAPEFVLRDRYGEYKDRIEKYSEKGYRVLVFAKYMGIPDQKPLTEDVEVLGFTALSNPIRKRRS